jgi:Fic family protein
MKINSKKMKYLSKITNSIYDDIKIEFLYHSNHLEGSTFSKEELDKLLLEKKVLGNHTLDDVIETKNSLELFDQVINDSDEKLDKFILFNWQRILKKGTVDDEINNIGMWKKYENKLRGVDLKLAYPEEVDSLMYNLLEDFNELENVTIKDIADFHYKFEKIHPFQDGNGRIGRFIILKQCLEKNIDLIAIDEEYSDEYKKALYIAQTTDNSDELVEIFKKCQNRLDDKLNNYSNLLEQIENDMNET